MYTYDRCTCILLTVNENYSEKHFHYTRYDISNFVLSYKHIYHMINFQDIFF